MKKNGQQSEYYIWEINKTKANLSKRNKTIELLREYNKQDEERLVKLTSYR